MDVLSEQILRFPHVDARFGHFCGNSLLTSSSVHAAVTPTVYVVNSVVKSQSRSVEAPPPEQKVGTGSRLFPGRQTLPENQKSGERLGMAL